MGESRSASHRARLCTPGNPKATSTPRSREQLDEKLGAGRHRRGILSRLHVKPEGTTIVAMSMNGTSRRVVAEPVVVPKPREEPAPRGEPVPQPQPVARQ